MIINYELSIKKYVYNTIITETIEYYYELTNLTYIVIMVGRLFSKVWTKYNQNCVCDFCVTRCYQLLRTVTSVLLRLYSEGLGRNEQ